MNTELIARLRNNTYQDDEVRANAREAADALEAAQAEVAQPSQAPEGYKFVVVPEVEESEPDWDEVRRQTEVATGLRVEQNTYSIIIREVRRWIASTHTAAGASPQPVKDTPAYRKGFSDGLKEAPEPYPSMSDALAAGDGLLHDCIDKLQARVAELEAQPSQAGRLSTEQMRCLEEAHNIANEESYFSARPNLEVTPMLLSAFTAAHRMGWNAAINAKAPE